MPTPLFEDNTIKLTYQNEWQDGFGARGWKIDIAIPDPEVIACTAFTDGKSPTAVIVHDVLDHFISGFGSSGYVNEARAIVMHGLRNGIEVRSSIEWLVNDILSNSSSEANAVLESLLIQSSEILTSPSRPCNETLESLRERYGPDGLRNILAGKLIEAGLSGVPLAIGNWASHTLIFSRMAAIGFCLQRLFEQADEMISKRDIQVVRALLKIGNDVCVLKFETDTDDELTALSEIVL